VQNLIDKARILIEALPYLSRFRDRTMVIKYGGHAMEDPALRESFAEDVILLELCGVNPVVVHGGGPQIGDMLKRLGVTSRFVGGMRVTDDATMDVVEMVLGGSVNKEIVRLINRHGGRAVGLTGKDGQLVRARKMAPVGGQDLGRVGEVVSVNPEVLRRLTASPEGSGPAFIPVIAPIGVDEHGETLNINADPFAGAIAAALRAEKLVLLTDVAGVKDAAGNLLGSLTTAEARTLIKQGVIEGGMIPKVECGLEALAQGVGKVHIIDGRLEHALLLEIFTEGGVGTELVTKKRPVPRGRAVPTSEVPK